jgi:hypothetical protein
VQLPTARIRAVADGALLQAGCEALLRRDLGSEPPLYRPGLRSGAWQCKAFKQSAASVLSRATFRAHIGQRGAGEFR